MPFSFYFVFVFLFSCSVQENHNSSSIESLHLSQPAQTLVESVVTKHSHFLVYDFFDLIKGLTIASSESRKDWTLIEDGTGNVNVSSWILDGDPSYLVHEYVTQNPY